MAANKKIGKLENTGKTVVGMVITGAVAFVGVKYALPMVYTGIDLTFAQTVVTTGIVMVADYVGGYIEGMLKL